MPVLHPHRHWGRRGGVPPLWSEVSIDRAHPLAAGLVGFWLLARGSGGSGQNPWGRNLLTGVAAPLNGNGNTGLIVSAAGRAMRLGGVNGGLYANGLETYGASGLIPFTIASRQSAPAIGANNGFWSVRTAGTQRNGFGIGAGAAYTYNVNYGTARAVTAAEAMVADTPRTLIGTTRAANDHELFIDGESAATGSLSPGTSPGQRNQVIIAQRGGGDGLGNVDFVFCAAWERGFSAEEAALFSADPYAFLVPEG